MGIILVCVLSIILGYFWRNIPNLVTFLQNSYHKEIGTLFFSSPKRIKVQSNENLNISYKHSISKYLHY